MSDSYVCPKCLMESFNPNDVEHSYCGNCHDFTGPMLCGACGAKELRIEYRETLQVRPLGTFSLSGSQMKFSGNMVRWPWVVCKACGAEGKGKPVTS